MAIDRRLFGSFILSKLAETALVDCCVNPLTQQTLSDSSDLKATCFILAKVALLTVVVVQQQ